MRKKKERTKYDEYKIVVEFMSRMKIFLEEIKMKGHRVGTRRNPDNKFDFIIRILSYNKHGYSDGDNCFEFSYNNNFFYIDLKYDGKGIYEPLYNYLKDLMEDNLTSNLIKALIDSYNYNVDYDKLPDIKFNVNDYKEYEDSNRFGL